MNPLRTLLAFTAIASACAAACSLDYDALTTPRAGTDGGGPGPADPDVGAGDEAGAGGEAGGGAPEAGAPLPCGPDAGVFCDDFNSGTLGGRSGWTQEPTSGGASIAFVTQPCPSINGVRCLESKTEGPSIDGLTPGRSGTARLEHRLVGAQDQAVTVRVEFDIFLNEVDTATDSTVVAFAIVTGKSDGLDYQQLALQVFNSGGLNFRFLEDGQTPDAGTEPASFQSVKSVAPQQKLHIDLTLAVEQWDAPRKSRLSLTVNDDAIIRSEVVTNPMKSSGTPRLEFGVGASTPAVKNRWRFSYDDVRVTTTTR